MFLKRKKSQRFGASSFSKCHYTRQKNPFASLGGCYTSQKIAFQYCNAVAGLIFETKIESFFLESFFLESFFLEQHYCQRTLFPSMSVEWIHFPRIRTFVQKRFHGLFSKKKRPKCGVFLCFQ